MKAQIGDVYYQILHYFNTITLRSCEVSEIIKDIYMLKVIHKVPYHIYGDLKGWYKTKTEACAHKQKELTNTYNEQMRILDHLKEEI